jgi:phenylacetic acid degradation operon negative regulatory protein
MDSPHSIRKFLTVRMAQGNISSTSLLITLFCDAITRHGSEIWLGSLIRSLEPLGISERLVRTAVFRLVQDDWLSSRKEGRRSYYGLSPAGFNQYQRAARRIYTNRRPEWDGVWTLVIPSFVDEDRREPLRKGLLWQGFGMLSPGVYAMPSQDRESLNELLVELNARDSVVIMTARADETVNGDALQRQVMERWNLAELGEQYQSFLKRYRPVLSYLSGKGAPDPERAFLLRTLLIHDYRRILLRDPELPIDMLPNDWAGFDAHNVTADIYKCIGAGSATWFSDTMENASGSLPAADPIFFKRYGGIPERCCLGQ